MKTVIHSQRQPGVSRSYSGISHHTTGHAADYREHLDETWRDKIAEIIWKRTEQPAQNTRVRACKDEHGEQINIKIVWAAARPVTCS